MHAVPRHPLRDVEEAEQALVALAAEDGYLACAILTLNGTPTP
jgi:hypothetical protein